MADWGVARWIAGKVFGLPSRQTRRIGVQRDLPVTMPDGAVLLADRHFPQGRVPLGTVLMRSPYGKGTLFGLMAGLLAERGFATVVQCVRGTMGSGGTFEPLRQEGDDGAATIGWLRAQPWFQGPLFTFGPSYLGTVQWAMADAVGDRLDGMGTVMTLSNFRDHILHGGGFSQAFTLGWAELMRQMIDYVPGRKMRRPKAGSLDPVHPHLPVGTLDVAAFGEPIAWWRDWVLHEDPADPWWRAVDFSGAVTGLAAPVTMVGGWQDVFLPYQIQDFQARQAAGRPAFLTIGPWQHASMRGMFEGLKLSLAMFTRLAAGDPANGGRPPVRLYLQGAAEWRGYPSWPPPAARDVDFFLRAGGRLDRQPPQAGEGTSLFTYDPADPTPDIHGPRTIGGSRVREMSALERRGDVLVHTGTPLPADMDAIGPVTVDLHVRADREQADFFACLCDVDPKGRSILVSDGYLRLRGDAPVAGPSGVRRIGLSCWPTAWRFRRGHRLRLIIAGGAHPRFARNNGTGDPLATATDLRPTRQEVFHDDTQVSALRLTIVGAHGANGEPVTENAT